MSHVSAKSTRVVKMILWSRRNGESYHPAKVCKPTAEVSGEKHDWLYYKQWYEVPQCHSSPFEASPERPDETRLSVDHPQHSISDGIAVDGQGTR